MINIEINKFKWTVSKISKFVTVAVAPLSILPFLLYVQPTTDGMFHFCRSELYILPRCSNVFIHVSSFCLRLVVHSCMLYCLY